MKSTLFRIPAILCLLVTTFAAQAQTGRTRTIAAPGDRTPDRQDRLDAIDGFAVAGKATALIAHC